MLRMDKRDYDQVQLKALSVISDGHGPMMTALLDMRIVLRSKLWRHCTNVMIASKLRGAELWALYHDVCGGSSQRFARYLYALSTGAAPLSTVRQGLYALTHGGDMPPEALCLHQYEGIPAPWMEPWIELGEAYFGLAWRWEGL